MPHVVQGLEWNTFRQKTGAGSVGPADHSVSLVQSDLQLKKHQMCCSLYKAHFSVEFSIEFVLSLTSRMVAVLTCGSDIFVSVGVNR